MKILNTHPRVSIAIAILVLIFLAMFSSQQSVNTVGMEQDNIVVSWKLAENYNNADSIVSLNQNESNSVQSEQYTDTYQYIEHKTATSSVIIDTSLPIFDIDAWAKELAQPKPTQQAQNTPVGGYEYIPAWLMSTTSIYASNDKNAELRQFGNKIGAIINSFEQSHQNQSSVLQNHAENPRNIEAILAMKKLGSDLAKVGDNIDAVDSPDVMRSLVKNLSDSYREIGFMLSVVTDAKGDEALFTAMETYNSSAEKFASNFVSVALQFQAMGVTFGISEQGNIFSFSGFGM